MKSSWMKTVIATSLVAMATAGCGTEVEPLGEGSFELNWDVSPRGCEAADVRVVEVTLTNAHREYVEQYDCDSHTASISGIEPAKYDLVLSGLDPSGHTTFVSDSKLVTIKAERVNVIEDVRLTAKPANLRVNWTFANSRVCGANGVDRVEVALFDNAYYEVARRTFGCDRGGGVFEDLRAGAYTVEAVAESDAEAVYHGLSDTALKRGGEGHVEVVLD
ncbi:MAG: hypothetical protein ACQEVA_05000 [Myxococcota bacterium]